MIILIYLKINSTLPTSLSPLVKKGSIFNPIPIRPPGTA